MSGQGFIEGFVDCRIHAEHAMKMAVASTGPERLKWVRIALAWLDLGAGRTRLATTETRND
jgi:hypothetical protein